MRLEVKELVDLLNVSNDLRKLQGDEALRDLPRGIPGKSTSCLVANAFNYGCEVAPKDPSVYIFYNKVDSLPLIIFESPSDTDKYLSVVKGAKKVNSHVATMPWWLNQIAYDFDRGVYREYEIFE